MLRDVSFSVAPGESIALVGATGAGKTTISKLLNRCHDIQRGRILVEGVDIRAWDVHALRSRIGVVLQDVFLFVGDVATNMSLGRTDLALDDLKRAARHVNAAHFIRECQTAITNICMSGALTCLPASASFCRLPAPWRMTRPSWYWMKPPQALTRRPKCSFRMR